MWILWDDGEEFDGPRKAQPKEEIHGIHWLQLTTEECGYKEDWSEAAQGRIQGSQAGVCPGLVLSYKYGLRFTMLNLIHRCTIFDDVVMV